MAAERVADEGKVLRQDRLVHAELLVRKPDVLERRVAREQHHRRVAGEAQGAMKTSVVTPQITTAKCSSRDASQLIAAAAGRARRATHRRTC